MRIVAENRVAAGPSRRPPDGGGASIKSVETGRRLVETVRRAFAEFLTIPALTIAAFLMLAAILFALDAARIAAAGPDSRQMWGGLFSDPQATRDFLGVIAGSIITVTSITFSLLLIAVQQGAAALTSLVFDQFLRRKTNQLYFGFFIGLALYSLIVLTSVTPSHQPIYGAATAGVLTVVALFILIILIYTTIDQMRPVVILRSIHDHTLHARRGQLALLAATRRAPRLSAAGSICVAADCSGYVIEIDVHELDKALGEGDAEIVLRVSIGDYVAFGEPLADVRQPGVRDGTALESAIRDAVEVEAQRDLDADPAFGVEQVLTIGWTSISTAKSNPGPGLIAILNLRDLLARWLDGDPAFGNGGEAAAAARVVYTDNLPDRLMKAFDSLFVVASESMQHQSAAELYLTFAKHFANLPRPLQDEAVALLSRSLSGLGDHVLTRELDEALAALAGRMAAAQQRAAAAAVETARTRLAASIGQLNARSTRAEAGEGRTLR